MTPFQGQRPYKHIRGKGTEDDPSIIWLYEPKDQAAMSGSEAVALLLAQENHFTHVWLRKETHGTRSKTGNKRIRRKDDNHITVYCSDSNKKTWEGHVYCTYENGEWRFTEPSERKISPGEQPVQLWPYKKQVQALLRSTE